jgi:hypothetical protein
VLSLRAGAGLVSDEGYAGPALAPGCAVGEADHRRRPAPVRVCVIPLRLVVR